jgi:hypothetical protein
MVKQPSGSRPAALSQSQVDDLVRGNHDEAAKLLRSRPYAAPPDENVSAGADTRPVDVSAKEIASIRRTGLAPKSLASKISTTTPHKEPAQRKGKAASVGAKSPTAPTLKP